ncbi:hypothetical protein SLS60_004840 [Paraconiothyrium brasiliense]|uniref:BTB domain-containing protein n=1 Tax=Paraconiothyrium brasiliense TaxID=300254 RepID=A0ABR3RMZ2_9PLEO
MPEHAEIFAYCPTNAAVSPTASQVHSLTYTNNLVEVTESRHAPDQADVTATVYQQQAQAQAHAQQPAQSPAQTQSYQAYKPMQPLASRILVTEREVGVDEMVENGTVDDNSRNNTSPSSPATGSTTIALIDGSNNDTATIARSESIDATDIPDAPLASETEITIHPKGNLLLIVGSDAPGRRQRRLLVHSDTIEHFGPLWVELIKYSNRARLFISRRTAYLLEDDADMFLVLMYLSHPWHIAKVPRELSFRQLLAMARICEKYDMNQQVSPFVRRWIVPHQESLIHPGREQWLFVAQQFGLGSHYVTLARHLVLKCRADRQRNLIMPGRWKNLEGWVPEGALVEIRRKRMKALAAMLEIVYTLVDGLENGDSCRAILPTSPDEGADALLEAERAMCTHCNHGELIRYLKIHAFWPPIVQSSTITSSVDEARLSYIQLLMIFEKLSSVPAISYRHMRTIYPHTPNADSAKSSGNAHAICDVGKQLAAMTTDVLNKLEMPISDSTVEVIMENAGKAGLKNEAANPQCFPPEESLDGASAAM